MIPSIHKGHNNFFFYLSPCHSIQTVTEDILWMTIVFPESYAEAVLSLKSDSLNCQIQQIRSGSPPCCEEVQG